MQNPAGLMMVRVPNIDLSNSGVPSSVTKTMRNKTNRISQYANKNSVQSDLKWCTFSQLFRILLISLG
jgi:hypothetical protein